MLIAQTDIVHLDCTSSHLFPIKCWLLCTGIGYSKIRLDEAQYWSYIISLDNAKLSLCFNGILWLRNAEHQNNTVDRCLNIYTFQRKVYTDW